MRKITVLFVSSLAIISTTSNAALNIASSITYEQSPTLAVFSDKLDNYLYEMGKNEACSAITITGTNSKTPVHLGRSNEELSLSIAQSKRAIARANRFSDTVGISVLFEYKLSGHFFDEGQKYISNLMDSVNISPSKKIWLCSMVNLQPLYLFAPRSDGSY